MLDDLGWDPDDDRASFDLTLPVHELREALKRLRQDAEQGLEPSEEERRAHEEFEEVRAYFERARDVCGELIGRLGTEGPGRRPGEATGGAEATT